MLSRSASRGICASCRSDLQVFFERGFCVRAVSSQPSSYRHRQRHQLRPNARNFSGSTSRFAPSNQADPRNDSDPHEPDLTDEEAALVSQAAIIELLEKELGKPLEQAIEEDKISAESIAKYLSQIGGGDPELPIDDSTTTPVAELRSTGASAADIVRLARQTHGDALPEGTLNDDELELYKRLYGDPVKEVDEPIEDASDLPQNELYTAEGEPIEYQNTSTASAVETAGDVSPAARDDVDLAYARAVEVARSLNGSMVSEDEFDDVDEDEETEFDRTHPLTRIGKFQTNPKTVFLPQENFVKPISQIMGNFSNKHLKETCERVFGGPGLPDSALTPRSGRGKKQVPIPLNVEQNTMGEMEANAFITTVMPPTYASIMSTLVETRKRLGSTWLTNLLARKGGPRVLDAGAGGAGIMAWREVVQAHWDSLHTSDEGSPPPPASKSVVLTGSDGLRHRAAALLENTTFVPRLPDYVHTRARPTIEDSRPAQQRKQFDVIIAPHGLLHLKEDWMRKQYVQNLWSLLSDEGGVLILIEKGVARGFEAIAGAREMLLSRYIAVPEGQTSRYSGEATQLLEDSEIYKKETAMIVAPCTNHEKCPMYTTPGLSRGRRDICSFQQRYIRPPFLQRVLGAKDRNHDDVDFSYLSVMKGDDIRLRDITTWGQVSDPMSAPVHSDPAQRNQAHLSLIEESREGFEHLTPGAGDADSGDPDPPSPEQFPTSQQMSRIVFSPLKRRGHVSIDLCTPTGKIERWTIPKSFSRQSYRDARKSRWGDLWALGAKTQTARGLRLGTPDKLFGRDGEVIEGKGRGRKERLKIKAQEMLEREEEERMDELMEQRDLMAEMDEELDAQMGIPGGEFADGQTSTTPKALNNRERKQARKAKRTTGQSASSRELAFSAAQGRPLGTQAPMDEQEIERTLSEWQAANDAMSSPGRGKKGGAYGKGVSSSKTAKSHQKGRYR